MDFFRKGLEKLKNLFEKNELDEAKTFVYKSFEQFKSYYYNFQESFKIDFDKCKKGDLTEHNRELLWMLCLDILPYSQPSSWKKIITDLRSDYLSLKSGIITKDIDDFIKLNQEKGGKEYNILSNKIENNDFELLDLIKIDILRTNQDIDLFQKDKTKILMAYTLFIYSKKFPLLGYKQGMSDICGIFYYVLYKNYRLTTSFTKNEDSFLYYIFHSNNEFLENDLYIMYSSFMNKGIGELYLYSLIKKSPLSSTPLEKKLLLTKEEIDKSEDSLLKKRMYHVFYRELKNFDVELYNEIINKVEPELFLFRWYLCILTREFPINKVIHLWDLFLCYDFIEYRLINNQSNNEYHYRFFDSIALSMILCCKNNLMNLKNENESLSLELLMHYPEDIKIETIIKEALQIDSNLNQGKTFYLNEEDSFSGFYEYIDSNEF